MDLVFVKNREPSKKLRCKNSMVSHFSLDGQLVKSRIQMGPRKYFKIGAVVLEGTQKVETSATNRLPDDCLVV